MPKSCETIENATIISPVDRRENRANRDALLRDYFPRTPQLLYFFYTPHAKCARFCFRDRPSTPRRPSYTPFSRSFNIQILCIHSANSLNPGHFVSSFFYYHAVNVYALYSIWFLSEFRSTYSRHRSISIARETHTCALFKTTLLNAHRARRLSPNELNRRCTYNTM